MKRPKMVSLDDETYAWAMRKDNFSAWVRSQIRQQIDGERKYAGTCPYCEYDQEWRGWPKIKCAICNGVFFGERIS